MHLTLTDSCYAGYCRDIERWRAGTPGTRPLSILLVGDEHNLAVGNALEMLAVGALAVTLSGLHELAARDPTVLESDLLHDRDRQTLHALHGAHKLPCRKHELLEEQSVSSSAQTTLSSALTLLGFCAPDRIQRNILSN